MMETKERIGMDATTLTHDQIKDITQREAVGESHEEEAELLRSDGYAEEWLAALTDLMSDLFAQKDERRAQLHLYKSTAPGRREYYEAQAQYGEWKAGMTRTLNAYGYRKREAERLVKQVQHRRHQNHQKEIGATHKLERLRLQYDRINAERGEYRQMLNKISLFLGTDAYFNESFLPVRDQLLSEIHSTLNDEKGPIEASGGEDGSGE